MCWRGCELVEDAPCKLGLARRRACCRLDLSLALGSLALLSSSFTPVEVKSGSCWTEGFQYEDCCAPEFGAGGNTQCWDEVYTLESCCGGAGGDPADLGCDSDYFQRFRKLVGEYYATGRARPGLIELYPRLIANFNSRFELCAPAALQASLLQLEERVALESSSAIADRLAGYALRLQRGLESGWLKAEDSTRWPLELGMQRVRTQSQRKAQRLARRRGDVTLVLSYCRENLFWMNSTFSRSILRHVDLAVVRKCPGVDVGAAIPHRHLWRSVSIFDVEDLPLRADECSAYLGYLVQKFEDLPEHMIFVHADAPEHIGSLEKPNILDDAVGSVLHGVHIPFAHLGGNRVTMAWKRHSMAVLWKGLFGSSLVPGPLEVRTYCCSHFVVSRDRVQSRSREFYKNALEFVTSPSSYSYLPTVKPRAAKVDIEGRLVCQNMMFAWHVIFGENLDLPHRMYDPQLPLFLKLRNLRTAYLDL